MRAAHNPDCRVRRRQAFRMCDCLSFHLGNNLFRLMLPAMDHQPARTFRHRVAQENNDDSQHCANAKSKSPAKCNGNNSGIKQTYGGGRANGCADPEAAVDNKVYAATDPRRDQLINGGIDCGIFSTNAGAGQRSKQRVGDKVPGECSQSGGAQVDQKGEDEQTLAPQAVSAVSEYDCANYST